ncbi:MAG: zinc metalloprotease HtpX [Candidatus Wildermuthbacteria bacterium GWA2_46_15]|uniref:Protease HtpX homolog n=1 Tax=Candidatus Wildermuthbacteria bacterium GWA2_46_15 TaxID=1802443 RepID=A0A1G2QNY7_9BACT|nr:MAG: zinc metalloprotease HtpX [Candidatus Wildermuthbacteria bacterium GWA2_46_15]
MTIYTQASSNVRKTWILLGSFLVFIIGLGWLFSYVLDNQLILVFVTVFSLATSFVSYWYSDKIVLAMTHAQEVDHAKNLELYHLLENLCIAAGLPQPKFYILEEAQPNAFATGRDPQHGVIVVTRGLLEKLEKPELEGVLAHELSHIGNRDSLLMTVVVILAGLVSNLSSFFFRMNWRRQSDDNNKAGAILMVAALAAAILAPLAALLIQLAISRKREFLADASGSLLTRYPEGLARALAKISLDPASLKVANPGTAHLYIVNPLRGKAAAGWLAGLFSTHPPINDRIKALREMSI